MKILMMTNTYLPIVGGLEKSIQTFTEDYRKLGHKVKIVAPEFKGAPKKETDVIRLPAIQKFNKTDFSLNLPTPGVLERLFEAYEPDVVHAHHPFLVGDLALRLCGQYDVPLVFTYHTMFEQYTDYFALEHEAVQTFVVKLAAGYANLADQVIVPSESIEKVLKKRGVKRPIHVVSTGFDLESFEKGSGAKIRKKFKIPQNSFVVGHLGRLSDEKNLCFLAEAVSIFLAQNPKAYFLIVGDGESKKDIEKLFKDSEVIERVKFAGILKGQELVDAYHAMDIFAFASLSETQGMVVTEAMSVGLPVVAVDAPGIREVVTDKKNGRLVKKPNLALFVEALGWVHALSSEQFKKLKVGARKKSEFFSSEKCAQRGLEVYKQAIEQNNISKTDLGSWKPLMNRLETEWDMFTNFSKATAEAIKDLLSV